jgi:hypothetical protein
MGVFAVALDLSQCDKTLIVDTLKSHLTLRQRITLYHSVNKQRFSEYKKEFGAEATFPIGDIMVTPQMDYGEFKTESGKYTEIF